MGSLPTHSHPPNPCSLLSSSLSTCSNSCFILSIKDHMMEQMQIVSQFVCISFTRRYGRYGAFLLLLWRASSFDQLCSKWVTFKGLPLFISIHPSFRITFTLIVMHYPEGLNVQNIISKLNTIGSFMSAHSDNRIYLNLCCMQIFTDHP